MTQQPKMRVWVDMDNSPHVPFFAPILRELQRRRHQLILTARPYAQTLELTRMFGIQVHSVGSYGGKQPFSKLWTLIRRAQQLWKMVRPLRPDVAVSHGSRAQVVAAATLGIPAVVCLDYEWTERWIFRWGARRVLVPEVAVAAALKAGFAQSQVRGYPGLKEEVYLPDFIPEPDFRAQLGIAEDVCLVVLRPPSLTANYRTVRTQRLFEAVLYRLRQEPSVVALLLPRSRQDREWVMGICRAQNIANIRIVDRVLPGLQLLYWADVVISGGGTMNREAALLGTPTYSVFAGPIGAVDHWLLQTGRLRLLRSVEDVAQLRCQRFPRTPSWRYPDKGLAAVIADFIEDCSSARSC